MVEAAGSAPRYDSRSAPRTDPPAARRGGCSPAGTLSHRIADLSVASERPPAALVSTTARSQWRSEGDSRSLLLESSSLCVSPQLAPLQSLSGPAARCGSPVDRGVLVALERHHGQQNGLQPAAGRPALAVGG